MKPDQFALLCFSVLMQNGGGILSKSPDYLWEKAVMLRSGYDAFAYLDIHNMRIVVIYFEHWRLALPEVVLHEFELQQEAAKKYGM